MLRIKDTILSLTKKDEEKVTGAHTDHLIKEYGDRRAGLQTSRLQKTFGYIVGVVGGTALIAGMVLAPYIAAPTALGLLKVSGALASGLGGFNLGVGLFREGYNGSKLKRIPGRA